MLKGVYYMVTVFCDMGKSSLLLYIHIAENKILLNDELYICMKEVSLRGS